MFLDPERGRCPAQLVDLAAQGSGVGSGRADLQVRCVEAAASTLWEGPVAWGQAAGQSLRRCSRSGVMQVSASSNVAPWHLTCLPLIPALSGRPGFVTLLCDLGQLT